ncbi:hypothetical protein [Alkaliphilus hydrothermalis]|uniref:Uncharacterized protein n=1 Tax=Alkaliphilus hydrothermalis TaxID=1482730 RepID=A0ABS2NNV2_9FIRM|nr:hypothetical protein [Alkaliphilus hydrothermalis]MBM7614624.1 hypothetical protein [Alkaliphilus hydrothermalis]
MANFEKEIITLLSTDIFKRITNSDNLQLAQIYAATSLLIKAGIPFDLIFSPGTRRLSSGVDLRIYINPTTQLNFVISFQDGGTVF